jgi:hypothetical protein
MNNFVAKLTGLQKLIYQAKFLEVRLQIGVKDIRQVLFLNQNNICTQLKS